MKLRLTRAQEAESSLHGAEVRAAAGREPAVLSCMPSVVPFHKWPAGLPCPLAHERRWGLEAQKQPSRGLAGSPRLFSAGTGWEGNL